MIKEINKKELLSRMDFFADQPDEFCESMARIAKVQTFQDNETIILAGDTRRAIFFIAKGSAYIVSSEKTGRQTILKLLGIGDFFGEHLLFDQEAVDSISVCAEHDCTVLVFGRNEFLRRLEERKELNLRFMTTLVQKQNKLYKQIIICSMSVIRNRIIACLMLFIDERGKVYRGGKGEDAIILRNRPTQQEIAAMCSATRETVNREMSQLVKQGFIKRDGKDLIILKELRPE